MAFADSRKKSGFQALPVMDVDSEKPGVILSWFISPSEKSIMNNKPKGMTLQEIIRYAEHGWEDGWKDMLQIIIENAPSWLGWDEDPEYQDEDMRKQWDSMLAEEIPAIPDALKSFVWNLSWERGKEAGPDGWETIRFFILQAATQYYRVAGAKAIWDRVLAFSKRGDMPFFRFLLPHAFENIVGAILYDIDVEYIESDEGPQSIKAVWDFFYERGKVPPWDSTI